jgi:DNA processing protein
MPSHQPDLFGHQAVPAWSAGQLAALLELEGIGSVTALKAASAWPDPSRYSPPSRTERAQFGRYGDCLPDRLPDPIAAPEGTQAIGYFDDGYPELIRQIQSPPAVLWVRGILAAGSEAVAVVGTRRPGEFGQQVASYAGRAVAQAGMVTVSGLALGCDAIAHESALDEGGLAVAFLGGALMEPEPKANRLLAERILQSGGCLVTEVSPTTKNSPQSLVARDRLQSGFARATVICQTGIPGGTLHAARECLRQRRKLFIAVPEEGTPCSEEMAGNMALADPSGCDHHSVFGRPIKEALAKRPLADVVFRGPGQLLRALEDLR